MASQIKFENFEEHKVQTNESLDSIARQAGITWKQLAQFNWGTSKPAEINECLHDLVGCRHKTKDGKNYVFTSKDDPGIVYVPVQSPNYRLQTGRTHKLQVIRPHLKTDIEVETVDDFLQVVGNVTVVLKRKEGGPDVQITSDENGYGIAKHVLSGHYEVTVEGGGKAYFLRSTNQPGNEDPDSEIGKFDEAVIDTRQSVEALTQIVVQRIATPAQKQERKLLQKVYTRTESQTAKGRGEETKTAAKSTGYTRLKRTLAIDNLALIAGWTDDAVDVATLVSTVLPDFFACCDGAPANRGYYVWVFEPYAKKPSIGLYSSSGELEASFDLVQTLHAPFGAYSIFEDLGGQLFVDMMTKSYTIQVEGQEGEVLIEDLVGSADRYRLISARNAHAGQVGVIYLLPTLPQLAWMGMHGGSGRLEDYGNQESVNERVHRRNKIVCQRISTLYNGYVAGYRARVKKTHNEKELRKLGPPWAPYVMPAPGGSESRLMDLYSSYSFDQLAAWEAVSEQLDKFANHFKGRLSEGAPFISLKAKWEIGAEGAEAEGAAKGLQSLANGIVKLDEPLPVSVEVEGSLTFQFTDDEIRALTGLEGKAKIAAEGKFKKFNVGLEYKRSLKKPDEWEVTIKTGPLEMEANKDGTRKISIEALPEIWAESQYNPKEATFEGGVKIESGKILEILEDLPVKNKGLKEFLEKRVTKIVPKEISVHAGLVGLKQRTVLALITNAPGFFDRRDLDELVEMKWNTLTLDEQVHLAQLGWDQCSWDLKSYADSELPKTMEEEWSDFTPQQQIATLHLGFYDAEEYHERVEGSRTKTKGWKAAIQKMQCARKEGEEGAAPAAGE